MLIQSRLEWALIDSTSAVDTPSDIMERNGDATVLQMNGFSAGNEDAFVTLESPRRITATGKHTLQIETASIVDHERVPDARFTPPLVFAWVVALLTNMQSACVFGVTGAVQESAVLPGHSPFEWSVAVAILAIGGIFGSLFAGRVGATWARKGGLMTTASIHIVACLIMACSVNIYMFIFGRLVAGFAAGMISIFVPLYVRELSTPNLRGTLCAGYPVAGTFGILVCDGLAFAFSGNYHGISRPGWRLLVGFPAIIGFVQLVLLPFIPESPSWLVGAKRIDEADAALRRLRGTSDVAIELQSAQDALSQRSEGHLSLKDVLCDRSIRRLLVIGAMMPVIQQFSGMSAIFNYGNRFFENAELANPLVGTTLFGAINFGSTCIALVLMDRAGRRPLLIFSCVGILVSQVVVTITLLGSDSTAITVSVVAVLCCVAFYEFGVGPIAWMLAAEILPPAQRSQGVSVAMIVLNSCQFVVGLVYPVMQSNLRDYSLVPFTICMALALLFSIGFVPETKNKTVEEIREDMKHRNLTNFFACMKSNHRVAA